MYQKVFFGLLVGAKWFLASRLWRLINQMNGGGGDLSQLKLSLRFRSRLSRNSIKRPAPHILGIKCSLNRNPNHVEVLSCSTATHCYHWKVLETLEFTNCLCLNVRYLVSRRVKCQILYQNKYNNRISFKSSLKMAIILPRGQWYAPSAVINDAWYCIVLHSIAWYCMVLHGIAWYCMVLHGIAW